MVSERVVKVQAALVGALAAVISIFRLWLGNSDAISQVLWAEDGVFPLCIHKADFITCLVDPFAGYLLLLPRSLAWVVSVFPLESWALVANLLAAFVAGLASGFAFYILRRSDVHWIVAFFGSLFLVLIPIVGLEAINAVGSTYMPLLFLSATALLFIPAHTSKSYAVLISVLLLVTAATIPLAIVFFLPVLLQVVRKVVSIRVGILWALSLALGTAMQAAVVLTATTSRPIDITGDSISSWANSQFPALTTFWPGFGFGSVELFNNYTLQPFAGSGWLVVLLIAGLGTWALAEGFWSRGSNFAIGGLLWLGLLMSLLPTIISGPNNRYFVVPLVLWSLALLLYLEPRLHRAPWWVTSSLIVVLALIWSPAFAASEFRATPAPPWNDEVARVLAACKSEPTRVERIIFTPFWPPNWGDDLDEPSHPDISCLTFYRWID